MLHVTIDDKTLELESKITILEAAKSAGIKIPTLCHNDTLKPYSGCRICLVEARMGKDATRSVLVPSCSSRIEDGLVVETKSERVKEARIFIIELFLSRCPESEEIQRVAKEVGVPIEEKESLEEPLDVVGEYLLHRAPRIDHTNCILCGLCVRVCAEVPERHALSFAGRGMTRKVKTPFEKIATTCIGCGSCAYVCPTKTITIEEET
jgi:NADH dehydrogenase/NADH:ubiquinone oxidoreductase subunit G